MTLESENKCDVARCCEWYTFVYHDPATVFGVWTFYEMNLTVNFPKIFSYHKQGGIRIVLLVAHVF